MRERAKNLIKALRRNYKWSFSYKILTWIVITAVCVALTFLLEDFFFLSGRFRSYEEVNPQDFEVTYKNIQENPDGTLQATQAEATITYHFPETYIYKIRFRGVNPTNKKVQYEVVCTDSYPVKNVDFFATFNNSTENFVVDSVCSLLDVNIMYSENIPFRLEITELVYDFTRNYVRMFSTFLVLMVFGYSILCALNFIELKLERVLAVYLLTIGLLLCVLIPPRYTYDEYAHLLKAQSTSEGILYTKRVNKLNRPFAFDNLNEVDFRSLEDFDRYLKYYDRHNGDEGVDDIIISEANSYTFVPYIFSALGLIVARFTKVSVYFHSFFARAGNLLFITVCLYYAVKIFPSNKLLMFYTALFPIMMTLFAATGISGVQVAALYLGIALIAYYRMEDSPDITWWSFTLMLTLFAYVTFCRMTYGFLMLLLLLLPRRKFKNKWLGRLFPIIVALMTVILMAFVYVYTESISMDLVNNEGADMDSQLDMILKDPLKFLFRMFMYNIDHLISVDLLMDASLIIFTGRLWTGFGLFETILFIFLILAGDRDRLVFDDLKSRVIMWLAFALSIGASEFAIYLTFSEVNQLIITGFQARYVLSVILVPLLTFQSKRFYLSYDKHRLESVTILYTLVMLALTVGNFIVKYYR